MYHLIGIKDIEMSALAQVIHTLGYKVDGSDISNPAETDTFLKDRNIEVYPFNNENVHEDMIIIKGNDIPEDNVELVKAIELGLKIYSCSQMKQRFSEMFQTIAISGCTGKEITTEMMTYVLAEIAGCNYMLSDGRGFADKENKYLCLPASENKRKFLEINPYYAIITNIDLSYPDYYSNIDDIILAYQEFAGNALKMVLANGDDRYTRLINVNTPTFYYGLNDDNDIIAKEVKYSEHGTSFEVHVEDNYYGNFELPIYGKQMLLNVLSVIGICYYERIEVKYVSKALKEFFTNKKVFTEQQFKDITTVNCVVNHPKELKGIIKALEQKYPYKSLISVINMVDILDNKLSNSYIDALNLSDKIYTVDDCLENPDLPNINNKQYIKLTDINKLTTLKNSVLLFISKQKSNDLQIKFENIVKNRK